MSEFVQIRFQTSSKAIGNINHDFRLSKVNYLRDDMWHNKHCTNNYFNFDSQSVKQTVKSSYNEYNTLFKEKYHRNMRKGHQSDFLSGVITLSNTVNEKLEQSEINQEQLDQLFYDSLQTVKREIENEINQDLELFYYVSHYDEKTPHCHFAFSNHTKQGEAVYNKLRNKKGFLSKAQDKVGKVFNQIGFKRGIKKEITQAQHMSVRQMHEVEIKELEKRKDKLKYFIEKQEQIKLEIEEQKLEIKQLQTYKKELKQDAENRTVLKHKLDDIDVKIKGIRESIKDYKEFDITIKKTLIVLNELNENLDDEEIEELINTFKLYGNLEEYETTLKPSIQKLLDDALRIQHMLQNKDNTIDANFDLIPIEEIEKQHKQSKNILH